MEDAHDALVRIIVSDDRPIALRKKRRRSITYHSDSLQESNNIEDAQDDDQLPGQSTSPLPKTPAKAKKRVRFSDPGPEIASSTISTGITPLVRRTTLQKNESYATATPRWLSRPPRRISLPSVSADVFEPSSPIEVQFAPLRQILTPRTRRQLGRRCLSEEMNSIEAERKMKFKREQQIDDLREELEMERQKGREDREPETAETDRIRELENELQQLKTEMQSGPASTTEEALDVNRDNAMPLVETGIYEDPDCVLVSTTPEACAPLIVSDQPASSSTDQSNQTDIVQSSVLEMEDHIKTQTSHLLQARLDLERLYPGETSLPLTPPANGDCSPLLTAMLNHIRNAQSTIQSTAFSLRVSETQESNLRAQFNVVLANLDTTRDAHAQLLKGANAGAEKYAQARERIAHLEADLDEGSRSSEKLKAALNSYRKEIKSLEDLVTRVEREGNKKLEALRGEMDEAVADLECWVAAETRGRREAEERLDVQVLQMRMLESDQQELRGAVAEKQGIIRGLEHELEQTKRDKEDDAGRLNVKVGNIEEALKSAKADIQRLEQEKTSLAKAMIDGKQRTMKTVASLKEELRKAVRSVEGVVGGWEKDASSKGESIAVAGLLTPRVESGRFRDVAMDTVEGTVEMKRGKSRKSRRIDSGIGILEEGVDGEE